jgi:hypothetical protein
VLFYQSGLADDQLAALTSSVAEASLFAPMPAQRDALPQRAGPQDRSELGESDAF